MSKSVALETLLKKFFASVVIGGACDQATIEKHCHPDYVQIVDGEKLNLESFVQHMTAVHNVAAKIDIVFEHVIVEKNKVATVHYVTVTKKSGSIIRVKVIGVFEFKDNKLILCDELTRLLEGDVQDHDIGSRIN